MIPEPREKHTASLVGDNMYVFGGLVNGTTASNELLVFNLSMHDNNNNNNNKS